MKKHTLALILATMLLTGCSKVEKPLEVTKFTYSVSGMHESYTATFETAPNGGTHVTAELAYGVYHMDEVLQQDYMTFLSRLATDYRMDKWNGFDKVDNRILDGSMFSLEITLSDGKTIYAHGSNAYPKNFSEPMNQVEDLIDKLTRVYSDMYPKQIQSEEMYCFRMEFRGQPYTTSEFKLNCYLQDTSNQLEIRIRDREDLQSEDYAFYGTCREFPFGEVQALIRKYDIPSWNGWAMTDGEGEQFNLEALYDSGERIEAYGTVHPENYEAFREEIMDLLMEFIRENNESFTPY